MGSSDGERKQEVPSELTKWWDRQVGVERWAGAHYDTQKYQGLKNDFQTCFRRQLVLPTNITSAYANIIVSFLDIYKHGYQTLQQYTEAKKTRESRICPLQTDINGEHSYPCTLVY